MNHCEPAAGLHHNGRLKLVHHDHNRNSRYSSAGRNSMLQEAKPYRPRRLARIPMARTAETRCHHRVLAFDSKAHGVIRPQRHRPVHHLADLGVSRTSNPALGNGIALSISSAVLRSMGKRSLPLATAMIPGLSSPDGQGSDYLNIFEIYRWHHKRE